MNEFVVGLLFLLNPMSGEHHVDAMPFATMEECEAANQGVIDQIDQLGDGILFSLQCIPSNELKTVEASV
jgi:ADP-dependent phosphofructokinase/glucokinase